MLWKESAGFVDPVDPGKLLILDQLDHVDPVDPGSTGSRIQTMLIQDQLDHVDPVDPGSTGSHDPVDPGKILIQLIQQKNVDPGSH